MTTLHIEHAVTDFTAWEAVFDQFSDARIEHKVRRYAVSRPVDDPKFVMIRLDFHSQSEAEAFLEFLRGVWSSAQAAAVLGSPPRTRITETVEAKDL